MAPIAQVRTVPSKDIRTGSRIRSTGRTIPIQTTGLDIPGPKIRTVQRFEVWFQILSMVMNATACNTLLELIVRSTRIHAQLHPVWMMEFVHLSMKTTLNAIVLMDSLVIHVLKSLPQQQQALQFQLQAAILFSQYSRHFHRFQLFFQIQTQLLVKLFVTMKAFAISLNVKLTY